jgi:hypothetical protein
LNCSTQLQHEDSTRCSSQQLGDSTESSSQQLADSGDSSSQQLWDNAGSNSLGDSTDSTSRQLGNSTDSISQQLGDNIDGIISRQLNTGKEIGKDAQGWDILLADVTASTADLNSGGSFHAPPRATAERAKTTALEPVGNTETREPTSFRGNRRPSETGHAIHHAHGVQHSQVCIVHPGTRVSVMRKSPSE